MKIGGEKRLSALAHIWAHCESVADEHACGTIKHGARIQIEISPVSSGEPIFGLKQTAQLGDGQEPPPVVAVPTRPPLVDDLADTAPGGHSAEQLGSAPFDARDTDCGKKRSCGNSAEAASAGSASDAPTRGHRRQHMQRQERRMYSQAPFGAGASFDAPPHA